MRPLKSKKGFTLVELLIVVAIIGVLAAIAVPAFSSYRAKAFCSAIQADLANIAIGQESYYYENETYLPTTQVGQTSNIPTFTWSPGVTLTASAGNITSWSVTADHPNCLTGPYTWNSALGGMQ
ncbi:hypothetical protein MNBD_NITROSPINAE01-39 [hydrothermal vent metagenome]|uniref:Prepilin-type N-terminal cleavage/methylation domain-containing protein n=1 Tax=hydrothermal vent metagenome TaxID=652676 RepID=A0A3B1CXR2_9ZZZZ